MLGEYSDLTRNLGFVGPKNILMLEFRRSAASGVLLHEAVISGYYWDTCLHFDYKGPGHSFMMEVAPWYRMRILETVRGSIFSM